MKSYLFPIMLCMILPFLVNGQNPPTPARPDSAAKIVADTVKPATVIDTAKKIVDTVAAPKPAQNCYTKWYDYMSMHGAKPVTDGMQQVVVALRSGESCHCYMGKIEVVAGKIKAPLYIQQESGEYKTSSEMGKKLDAEFVSSMGLDLWKITDGMSALFRTADQEYGRIFFYGFANKAGSGKKEAPSPEDLINKQ